MIGLLVAAVLAVTTPGGAGSPLSTAATALRSDPVYVASTQADTIDVLAVQQAVRSVPQVQVAVLPVAAAAEAGGEPAAVPGALAGRTGRGGTLLVLVGNDLEAASTTLGATAVQDALATARPLLHADSASRTAAVTAAVRLLNAGNRRGLGEASSPAPHSAGNPSGVSGLIALAVLAIAGLAAVLVLPRLRRRQAAVPSAPPQREGICRGRTRLHLSKYFLGGSAMKAKNALYGAVLVVLTGRWKRESGGFARRNGGGATARWLAAYNTNTPAAFPAMYTKDAVVLPPGSQPVNGKASGIGQLLGRPTQAGQQEGPHVRDYQPSARWPVCLSGRSLDAQHHRQDRRADEKVSGNTVRIRSTSPTGTWLTKVHIFNLHQ